MGWSYQLLAEPQPCAACGELTEDAYRDRGTGELLCPDCWQEEEEEEEEHE